MIVIIELKVIGGDGSVKFSAKGQTVDASYNGEYAEGDVITVSSPDCEFLAVKLDGELKESIIYVPGGGFKFEIPFGGLMDGYSPAAFSGNAHNYRVSEPEDSVKYGTRLISQNSLDRRGQKRYFPHAYANLVTREAPCFFERNAIDGVCDNTSHGAYPYHSWAGGAREDLEYYLDFGREVEVEKIVFFLRADFPHDTYWKSIDVEFSDGEIAHAEFVETAEGQALVLDEKKKTKNYSFIWAMCGENQEFTDMDHIETRDLR